MSSIFRRARSICLHASGKRVCGRHDFFSEYIHDASVLLGNLCPDSPYAENEVGEQRDR